MRRSIGRVVLAAAALLAANAALANPSQSCGGW